MIEYTIQLIIIYIIINYIIIFEFSDSFFGRWSKHIAQICFHIKIFNDHTNYYNQLRWTIYVDKFLRYNIITRFLNVSRTFISLYVIFNII